MPGTATKDNAEVRSGPLADQLRIAVMRTSRRLRQETQGELVTVGQFSVLSALKHGSATLRELAEREQVSAPAMTRTVAALVDLGFVERAIDDHDRRNVLVSLTAGGRGVVNEARSRRTEWLAQRVSGLDDEERAVLATAAEILQRISRQ